MEKRNGGITMSYQIVTAATPEELETKVEGALSAGFRLHGALVFGNGVWAQAVLFLPNVN